MGGRKSNRAGNRAEADRLRAERNDVVGAYFDKKPMPASYS
jgi:hypothetical protein